MHSEVRGMRWVKRCRFIFRSSLRFQVVSLSRCFCSHVAIVGMPCRKHSLSDTERQDCWIQSNFGSLFE